MNIHFFCEYPEESITVARKIFWRCKIFIAANTAHEFAMHARKVKKINPLCESVWWPVLKKSIWLSGFSDPKELTELLYETQHAPKEILLDLELPILHPHTIIQHLFSLQKNKRKIASLFSMRHCYTAEYPPNILLPSWVRKIFGIQYTQQHTPIIMWYTSMLPKWLQKHTCQQVRKKLQKQPCSWVGLGTIATGALGNEPILSPQDLKRDLEWCKKANVQNVVIFRLGGINKQYQTVLASVINGTKEKP